MIQFAEPNVSMSGERNCGGERNRALFLCFLASQQDGVKRLHHSWLILDRHDSKLNAVSVRVWCACQDSKFLEDGQIDCACSNCRVNPRRMM